MKLYLTSAFEKKSNIPEYPMIGFWIQTASNAPAAHNFEYNPNPHQRSDKENNFLHEGKILKSNTFISNSGIRLSFASEHIRENSSEQNQAIKYLYLYAVDYFDYISNKSDFDSFPTSGDNEDLELKMFNYLAGCIELEDTILKMNLVNIIDLNFKPKCSIQPLFEDGQVQVSHYNDIDIGQSNFYTIQSNSILVDYLTGMDRIKDRLSYLDPIDLKGSMTIHKSGVIQL